MSFYKDKINKLMARTPTAEEVANLEKHALKLQLAIMENEWKIFESEDLDIAEMAGLQEEQARLQGVMQWFASIQKVRCPPRIQPVNRILP